MVLPWASGPPSSGESLPPWLPHFIQTAAHSALLVDWLIFHEGALNDAVRLEASPTNVKVIDLKPGELASLFGRTMSAEMRYPAANATAIINRMRYMFQKWPRLVAEYKPAFGAIFREYLSNYTHWGYCDFDMVRNTATAAARPRPPLTLLHAHSTPGARAAAAVIERDELLNYHIVTYSVRRHGGGVPPRAVDLPPEHPDGQRRVEGVQAPGRRAAV